MINQLLKKINIPYIYESADAVSNSDGSWLQMLWNRARIIIKQTGAVEFLLAIDEIQKVSNWSEIVKREWDYDSKEEIAIKVILCGSSRLLIQKGLTESLAGRFEKFLVGHWSFTEMEAAFGFTIDQYIYFGGYPGSSSLIEEESRWKSYIRDSLIETSISKDILMLTRIDKPSLLKRLFEIGSGYSGQILSYTKMLGQLRDAGNTTTLSAYLDLLNDAGLLGGVEKYAGEIVRKRSSSPKFQVYNNALMSARINTQFNEIKESHTDWGRLAESSAGTHLISHSTTERYQLWYWREKDAEVDFVMEKSGKLIAIEVKSGLHTANPGMKLFARKFNPIRMLQVGTGGMPIDEFLRINPDELF
jgi:hypothetical protein